MEFLVRWQIFMTERKTSIKRAKRVTFIHQHEGKRDCQHLTIQSKILQS